MNANTSFEQFTQHVYQKLVNNDVLKPTTVQHNVKLRGKSGCEHQIDVYWEYEIAGNLHRVAIECKNYDSLVPVGKVRDFYGVLSDLNNVNGIMVSKKGFQKGAKEYAAKYGISLKELRKPAWDDYFGAIHLTTQIDIRHTLFLFDEGWVTEHNFSLNRLRKYYAELQYDKADFWLTATHLPIETKDRYIRDSKGKIISSLDELEKALPDNPGPGSKITFYFEDGWVDSTLWGPVKIREVMFSYISEVQERTINLVADDFVEAILEDALEGKIDYVPKDY